MQVEDYFKENRLEELLKECLETFDKINDVIALLKYSKINNPTMAVENIQILGGCSGYLNDIFVIAKLYEEDNATQKFNELRIAYEKSPIVDNKGNVKLFIQGTAEKEAFEYVAIYRRIRSIVQGYIDKCASNIGVLQTMSKCFISERRS
jgi:hypothetical protein